MKNFKGGNLPEINKVISFKIYDVVQKYGNKDAENEGLYNCFEKLLKMIVLEFSNQLKEKTNSKNKEAFIVRSNRINNFTLF